MIIHQREIGYGEITRSFSRRLSRPRHIWKKNILKSQWSSCTIWQDREAGRRFRRAMLRWPTTSESMPRRTTTRRIRSCSSRHERSAGPVVDQFYHVIQSP